MKPCIGKAAFVAAIFLTVLSPPASSKVLITAAEAKLPDDTFLRRDAFPGPKIVLESPSPADGAASSPLHLKLKFEPRGARIDPNSLYVKYKKLPGVDLTERLSEFTSPTGIDMQDAELPPGIHRISVEIKDTDGLAGHLDLILNVSR